MGDFVPLTLELLTGSLAKIKPTVGGGGFAFTELVCSGKELTTLGVHLEDCAHLQTIDLSENQISDITAVTALRHVVSLKLNKNNVESLQCFESADLPWCQRIDISSNKLAELPSLRALGRLRFLKVDANAIASLEAFGGHDVLEELDLTGNKLTSLAGLGEMGVLRKLVVTENQLESLAGLDAPQLQHLDVSSNALTSLEHIECAPACVELKFAGNQVPGPAEPNTLPEELLRLSSACASLTSVALSGNPVGDLKPEILICLPQLATIDDEPVTQEDRDAAVEREREIEEAREEAERAKLEAEAAAAAEEQPAEDEEG